MTIYTDQVTGKQYDRVPGGVIVGKGPIDGYVPCRECAFNSAVWHGECARASEHCVSHAQGKTMFFVFKGRKT